MCMNFPDQKNMSLSVNSLMSIDYMDIWIGNGAVEARQSLLVPISLRSHGVRGDRKTTEFSKVNELAFKVGDLQYVAGLMDCLHEARTQ